MVIRHMTLHISKCLIMWLLQKFDNLSGPTKRSKFFCDNMAVVQVLTTGKARDAMLAKCAQNIWFIAAMINIDFLFSHLPDNTNVLADLLSRWQIINNPTQKLNELIQEYTWIPTHLTLTLLNYQI